MSLSRFTWPQEESLRFERLQKTLGPARLTLLQRIAAQARTMDMSVYLVGGFVRDLLLGWKSQDFDLVVEGDAIALASALQDKYGGRLIMHPRFKTSKWYPKGEVEGSPAPFLDLITARRESYGQPGSLPRVQPGRIEEDIARRDFTINTLALRLDRGHFGELRDDRGGMEDLNRGLIRVLHSNSYRDDPTRILRAARYEQRYGFQISNIDQELIAGAQLLLGSLSADRTRHELNSILAEEKSPEMLERLQAWGVLAMIHPALGWDHKMRRRFLHRDDPPSEEWGTLPNNTRLPRRIALGYLLWLMHLSSEQLRALDRRLHFSAALRDSLQEASALRRDLPDLKRGKPSQIHARLVGVPLLVVYAVSLSADAPGRQVLNAFGMRWRHIKPRTTGLDLMARGVPAGPAYQEILKTLRTAWLDGGVNTPEEELALLDQLVRSSAQGEKRIGDR